MKKLVAILMMAFAVAMVSCDDKSTEPEADTGLTVTPVAGEIALGATAKVNVTKVGNTIIVTGVSRADTQDLIGAEITKFLGVAGNVFDVPAFIVNISPIVIVKTTAAEASITEVDIEVAMPPAGTVTAVIDFTVENGTDDTDHRYGLKIVSGT